MIDFNLYLNLAKINWLQPLTLNIFSKFNEALQYKYIFICLVFLNTTKLNAHYFEYFFSVILTPLNSIMNLELLNKFLFVFILFIKKCKLLPFTNN